MIAKKLTNAEKTKRYEQIRRDLIDYYRDRPCLDCNGKFPIVCMDFDHREATTKSFTIACAGLHRPIKVLLEEIAKCDVICSNCHRLRTAKRCGSQRWLPLAERKSSDQDEVEFVP